MDSPSEATASPQTLSAALARSRSRYKGSRPNRPATSHEKPPTSHAYQWQQLEEQASNEARREDPINARCDERVVRQRLEVSEDTGARKGGSPKTAHPTVSHRSRWEDRTDKEVGTTAASKEVAREVELRPKPAIIPEKIPRDYQPKLLSKRREEQPTVGRPTSLPTKSLTQRITGQRGRHQRAQSKEELKRIISAPIANEPPEVTVAPAFDAPISAVNAGERRVMVKYGQSVLSIPVTPSTTPLDIIRSAGEQIPDCMDPKATVLLESFRQLDLERPLRKYEHVRDVMNSWDTDASNTLIIIPSPTGGRDTDLELSNVSSSQPGDTSVHVYHSQKPGHWDKRWVTLRSDGQVFVAKRGGGETSNICHLSDFDIYVPTARQLAKKIKPPRKICLCVKSQQKSSMFLSANNFVHFFCTNDKAVSMALYKAVQEWRSWYLVNVMGEGESIPRLPKNEPHVGDQATHIVTATKTEPDPTITPTRETLPQRLPTRSRGAPPVSFPKKLSKDAATGEATTRNRRPSIVQTSAPETEPEPFAAEGLLGRTYTLRQKAQRERDVAPDIPPTLPNHDQGTSLKRAASQRTKNRPLVDLTPQFQEPPQHVRKGRGVMPEHIPPGGLAELATSPEAAIPIPPSTTWQRPRTSSGNAEPDFSVHRARTIRRGRSGGPPSSSAEMRQASTSPEKASRAFIGGLLASNNQSQGGTGTGRGVMTGDRTAKAPMLDVGEESQYKPGSLLDRVERSEGGPGPVIEREKRREVSVGVGEGI